MIDDTKAGYIQILSRDGCYLDSQQQEHGLRNSLFVCCHCANLLVKAYQTPCGCFYCQTCVNACFPRDREAPCLAGTEECTGQLWKREKDIREDRGKEREVLALRVRCPAVSCSNPRVVDTVKCLLEKHFKEHHYQKPTPALTLQCPLVPLGCSSRASNKEDIQKHFNDVNTSIQHVQLIASEVNNCEEKLRSLHMEVSKWAMPNANIKAGMIKIQSKIASLLDWTGGNMMRSQQQQQQQHKEALFQQPIWHSSIPYRACNGSFTWKILNYSQQRRLAEEGHQPYIDSQPIYTKQGEPAYCYKFRLYLCGNNNNNNSPQQSASHMSIFFQMAPGQWDTFLSWPCLKKVVISLIRKWPISSAPSSSVYLRPTTTDPGVQGPPSFHTRSPWTGEYKFVALKDVDKFVLKDDDALCIHVKWED